MELRKEEQEAVYKELTKRGWTKVIHEVDMICMVNRKGKYKKQPIYAEIHNDGNLVFLGIRQ